MNHQENNKDRVPSVPFETAEELLFKETSAGSKTEEPAATGARTTTRNSTQRGDILRYV